MSQYKKINIFLLVLALMVGLGAAMYWKFICSQQSCSYEFIMGLLEPLEVGGYIVAAFAGVFLFLPTHYFESWLKRIFSWAFPLCVVLVITTQDNSSILSFSRALVVQLLGAFFGVVSAVFILYRYLKLRSKQVATINTGK